MGVAQQAFSKTGEYRSKISESEITIITHRYQRIGSTISDQSQQIQSAERDNAQMYAKLDQFVAAIMRIFELIGSSSG